VLGPWAAILAVSVALVIQALFFGDGGILAIGANVFNLAITMSFVGYYLYRWLSGNTPIASKRRVFAAAIAGYVSINVAAFFTGVELGIQPILFRDAAGRAIYFPYGIELAVPAMMIGHLTIAGAVEALATGLVVAWMQRTNPELLGTFGGTKTESTPSKFPRWAWLALGALIVLTPMGLLAPGTAWGEWGRDELAQLGLGYIPAGFDRWSGLWGAPLPDYNIPVLNNPTIAYFVSAIVGVAIVVVVIFAIGWIFEKYAARSIK
jgi:cobalt/nickel transport system permease protein